MIYFDVYRELQAAVSDGTIQSLVSHEAKDYLHRRYPNAESSVTSFFKYLKIKWTEANRTAIRFEQKHDGWLKKHFDVGEPPAAPSPEKSIPMEAEAGEPTEGERLESRGPGRPKKLFVDLTSPTTKRARSSELASRHEVEELLQSGMTLLRAENRPRDADILKKISQASKDGTCTAQIEKPYTPDEALALLLDARQSKEDYQTMRSGAVKRGCQLYPPYNDVRAAKDKCMPSGMLYEDYSAEVPLQDLLDHTVQRLIKLVEPKCPENSTLLLTSKVGFDGSTGQSVYKKIASEDELKDVSVEQSLFLTCLVPLQLKVKETGEIIYNNEKASSTHFCRPIRFQYVKETEEVLRAECDKFKKDSESLHPSIVNSFAVEHKIEITMIDGKVQTTLSDKTKSSQCCSVCGLNPVRMNNFEAAKMKSEEVGSECYAYGLSTLHMWIRFMECLLHIAYRLEFKKWQTSKKQQHLFDTHKKRIQVDLREKHGLLVDMPRAGGAGNSNDGNTARRFFQHYESVSEILGVDVELTRRFHVILCTLSTFNYIDADKLQVYCEDTMKLYVSLYDWYYMPQSVHKVLWHAHQVVRSKELPIGMLSEEAQEASNKKVKNFREFFTRKVSRMKTNEDLMRRLMAHSDPYISSLRRSMSRKTKETELPADSKAMLLEN